MSQGGFGPRGRFAVLLWAFLPYSLANTRRKASKFRLAFSPSVMKLNAKYFYPLVTRGLGADEMLFLSVGYEEDPPMVLPLAACDEPDRFCIQLYHRTASHRYQVTDLGLDTAKFLTTIHDRLLPTGLAELADLEPNVSRLRTVATAYRNAVDTLSATTQFAA